MSSTLFERCLEGLGVAPSFDWEKIEIVRTFFSEESQDIYDREILYLAKCEMQGADTVFPPPFSWDQREQAIQNAREMMAAGLLPKLSPEEDDGLPCLYAITFILEQYRYKDIVKFEKGELLYDCGAYIGDVSVLCALNGGCSVAFEPVPQSFEHLQKNATSYGSIQAVRLGVGDANETRKILAEDSILVAASVSNEGNLTIELRKIDDLVETYGVPTFIKMDLEGYEIPALRGAEQTIRQHRPKLAVCLYHRLDDMWKIPLLLKQFVPEYRFFCKKSAPHYEFVLFAITESREA